MVCEALFKKIEALEEKYLAVWEEVCNIESPAAKKIAAAIYCL